jgi:electron-transferring-flavoprotein dehydrogenase
MPHLAADGALFTGNGAAMHSTPAIKGIHLAMKSGMLAAETILDAIDAGNTNRHTLDGYRQRIEASWAGAELREGRNFAQALSMKGPLKWIHLAAQYISKGKGLVDRLPAVDDATTLEPASAGRAPAVCRGIKKNWPQTTRPWWISSPAFTFPAPCTGRISPAMSSFTTSGCAWKNAIRPTAAPARDFARAMSTKWKPAEDGSGIKGIKLNFTNCLHCKTCDIKDPFHNVTWTCPEGGEGPNYKQA